eukprot:TRINITY_DN12519_c0_g1_i1.p1 TRINITY_DN12519_c0_g1~~TRINITY_DN12519_c0_g1_i1.p1  ORF type:complete len:347 (+),score=168.40 TRINITY_DN12519_c0_g1_i1:29-1042(+)
MSHYSTSEQHKDAEELVARAEDLVAAFDMEAAAHHYGLALDLTPTNTLIMDDFASVLLDLGDEERARQLLLKSIELSPQDNATKYMNLAQLLQDKECLECYQRGVDIMIRDLRLAKDDPELKRQISTGYASMAELYLTDCCFEDNAEVEAERLLNESIKYDATNPEPLQLLSSVRLSQIRREEALEILIRSYQLWEDEELDEKKPSFSCRISTARQFIELERHDLSAQLLDDLIAEIDNDAELWYLLGLSQNAIGIFGYAKESLTKAKELALKSPFELVVGSGESAYPLLPKIEELLAKVNALPADQLVIPEEDEEVDDGEPYDDEMDDDEDIEIDE